MVNLKKFCKNTLVILFIFLIVNIMIPFNESIAVTNISVTGPSIVVEGQSAVFNVVYASDVIYINLSSGDIVLNGFQATVSVSGSGNSRKIVLNNVRGTGENRSITIASGTGYVGENKIEGTTSNAFKIKSNVVVTPKPNPVPPVQNNNNTQKPVTNNNNNNNSNTNTNTNTNQNVQNNNTTENNTQTENTNKEENNQITEETKPQVTVDYDKMIPIPNTGK